MPFFAIRTKTQRKSRKSKLKQHRLKQHRHKQRKLQCECLEIRNLLTSDFGDAPAPYPTLSAEDGPEHTVVPLMLGSTVDVDSDGVHSATASADTDDGVVSDNSGGRSGRDCRCQCTGRLRQSRRLN
jgi:hypothetical protein